VKLLVWFTWSACHVFVSDDCSDSDVANLIQEMEVMKIIGQHRNVLSLIGCCTQNGTHHRLSTSSQFLMLRGKPGNCLDFLLLDVNGTETVPSLR